MIFDVYLDESGTHDASKAVSVAGYLATAESWNTFSVEWKRALDEFELEWFHMVAFENNEPPYDGWPADEREQRFSRLVSIINRHVYASVGCMVPTHQIDAIFPKAVKREVGGGAYGVAFTALCMEIAQLLRDEPDHWAAYVAGAGVKGRGKLLEAFARGYKKPEWKKEFRAVSLRFENPRQFLPLQAADIVAYELHHLLPRVRGLDARPVRRQRLDALDAAPRRKWIDLTDETLENFAKALTIKIEYESERVGRRRQRRGR